MRLSSAAADSVHGVAASQRVRSRVPAPQRSILPTVPGIPAGAAVLIAVACTFLGFVIDARGDGDELTATFAALYVAGCVAAVLLVRFRGLFTTMVLPPLLMFIAVPLAYMQLTGRTSTSIKDILLNLAIPLVHRFPTMLLATALVLAIGGARIFLHRREDATERPAKPRRSESWGRSPAKRTRPARKDDDAEPAPRRRTRRTPDPAIEDPDTVQHLPRVTRRPPAEVADAPPRVASGGRTTREPRTRTRPAAGTPRTGSRGTEMPPHPRPNVRYRESSRTDRPNPEDY